MRYGLSAIVLTMLSVLSLPSVLAQDKLDVAMLESQNALAEKRSELEQTKYSVTASTNQLKSKQQQIKDVKALTLELNAKLVTAKQRLSNHYAQMISDPELDITSSQIAYQQAWNQLKAANSDLLLKQQQEQELQYDLQQTQKQLKQIEAQLDELSDQHIRARVARLRSELQRTEIATVSYVNTCSHDMTLNDCKTQAVDLGLQKLVNQFKNTLFSRVTESEVVKQNQSSASLNVNVIKYVELSSGFFEQNKYETSLKVELNSELSRNTPCKLLGLNSSYCFANAGSGNFASSEELAWYNVVVRSNQYNDNVIIDEVSYGSTPIEVMLSGGVHDITIEKAGYKIFHRQLTIKEDQTLRANLVAEPNTLKAGEVFADLVDEEINAPEVSVVTPDRYWVGENASKQFDLEQGFALGSTPVTVGDFRKFVAATGYETEAERSNRCLEVKEAAIVFSQGNNWKNPGYQQSDDFPVVCVNQNDALAYSKWLSNQTGFTYRLPSQDEWEVASRARSTASYWWGAEFGVGRANTGWSGTPWSNVSASPVKSFSPNQLGMYDMVGNVWQWTADPKGVLKGGAWSFSSDKAKAESQFYLSTTSAANFAGFRVLREL